MENAHPSLLHRPTTESIAHRIRTLRQKKGWTLADVEKKSHGAIKAVVLGSYERGDREISLKRAISIAEVFGVPLTHLLHIPTESQNMDSSTALILDLRHLNTLVENQKNGSPDQYLSTAQIFVAWIAGQRGDWNGEVMSIRKSDLETLSLMSNRKSATVLEWLEANKLLLTATSLP